MNCYKIVNERTVFMNVDELCINTIRMLSVDMVEEANSGHPGMPMEQLLWHMFSGQGFLSIILKIQNGMTGIGLFFQQATAPLFFIRFAFNRI